MTNPGPVGGQHLLLYTTNLDYTPSLRLASTDDRSAPILPFAITSLSSSLSTTPPDSVHITRWSPWQQLSFLLRWTIPQQKLILLTKSKLWSLERIECSRASNYHSKSHCVFYCWLCRFQWPQREEWYCQWWRDKWMWFPVTGPSHLRDWLRPVRQQRMDGAIKRFQITLTQGVLLFCCSSDQWFCY